MIHWLVLISLALSQPVLLTPAQASTPLPTTSSSPFSLPQIFADESIEERLRSWLSIAVFPIVLLFMGRWLDKREEKNRARFEDDRKRDLAEKERIRFQNEVLQNYILKLHDSIPELYDSSYPSREAITSWRIFTSITMKKLGNLQNDLVIDYLKQLGLAILTIDYSEFSDWFGEPFALNPFVPSITLNYDQSILTYIDLAGSNLKHADLRALDFTRANLSKANLSNVDLTHANLRFTSLCNANLIGAKLFHADLLDADFHDAILCFANLEATNLVIEQLEGAHLYKTRLPKGIKVPQNETQDSLSQLLFEKGFFEKLEEAEAYTKKIEETGVDSM